MNDLTFARQQVLRLQGMLDSVAADSISRPQLQARLEEAEERLRQISSQPGTFLPKTVVTAPHAAIFISGGGVRGSVGVRPSLAGQALIQYKGMFVEQALHDEREAAKAAGKARRRRGSQKPELLFVGTPRGSFGLEFAPDSDKEEVNLKVHAQSMENVANALLRVASSDPAEISDTINSLPHGVVPYLKRFFAVLSDNGAEIRLAFSDKPARNLDLAAIKQTAELLEKEVFIERVTVVGIFRGLTRESGWFDLKPPTGPVITGRVADGLTEEDVERINALSNQECEATLEQTTVTKIAGAPSRTHVLMDARPTAIHQPTTSPPSAEAT